MRKKSTQIFLLAWLLEQRSQHHVIDACIRQAHVTAYVSIRHHTSREHLSKQHVNDACIRQHTSAYVSIRLGSICRSTTQHHVIDALGRRSAASAYLRTHETKALKVAVREHHALAEGQRCQCLFKDICSAALKEAVKDAGEKNRQ